MNESSLEYSRDSHEHPTSWLWGTGLARVIMLLLAAMGSYTYGDVGLALQYPLAFYYVLGFSTSITYLYAVKQQLRVGRPLTWLQLLIDFGVVAATVSFTGGPASFFTFLFVFVILEGALLLGLANGFVFASFATLFMLVQTLLGPPEFMAAAVSAGQIGYNFLVQGLAYYLTAAISGFWNQRIRRMQQFQSEILDNMNNGFLITDAAGIVTAQNKAADRILHFPRGAAIGRPVQEIVRVESGGECPIITALRSGRDFTSYEFHGVCADGAIKLLGLTTSRIYDAREHLTGVIASFSDLTEMAEMRDELQRQDRMAVIGELAAGLAHEIRNPVASIRGALDEVRNCGDSNPLVQKFATIAIPESVHLNQIVSGFLDFARNPQLQREAFDLMPLVKDVAESLERKFIDAEGLSIQVHGANGPVRISGDKTQIKQVLFNLGKNGVEAMEEEGNLTITVSAEGNSAEIRIEDEGPGIPPDKVARIFEPFYTTKERGVGMGLSVCQRIITAHDGTVRAASREGGGTVMSVRLPAHPAEEE